MNIYNKLGIRFINDYEYNSINVTLRENYNISDNISFYTPCIELLTKYFKKTNSLNNSHKLIRLIKKKNRIQTIGYMYKALIKYKNKTYFTNVFIKELPLFSPDNLKLLNIPKDVICPMNNKFNDVVYNKNSSNNIEIFVNYLVSKLQENSISPSFCKFYGCYLVNMNKYTYDVSEEDDVSNDIINMANFYDGNYLELNNIYSYLLVTEKADYDIDFLKKINTLDYNLFVSFVFQIFCAIITMNNIFGIKHNDLHLGNIMVKTTKKQFLYYKLHNIIFRVPTYGYIIKIIDWGRATYNFKDLRGKNSIFNCENECFGQYIYTKCNNKKTSCDIKDNKWCDITIISHNLLYEFPEFRLSGLGKLLLANITAINGKKLNFNIFDWSIYRTIGKSRFIINPKSILKNRVFNKYRYKEPVKNEVIFNIF